MLHGHGDDGYQYKQAIVANFSSNVWFGGKSENLKQHLFDNWDTIHSYPEASAESLVDALAICLNVNKNQIIATNGATEAFYLIAQCFSESNSSIIIPTFSEYEDACRVNKHKLFYINWAELTSKTIFEEGLVWICNPNNPNGNILESDELEEMLKINSKSIFVIDEAYIDFTDEINSCIDLLDKYENFILVKSLTKNFSIPGLRLGYLISNKVLVQNIQFYKAPWTVNSLAIEAGKFLLANKTDFLPPVNYYKSETKKFQKNLQKISGLQIHPSKTSFFLVELEESSAFELKKFLILNFGILIRDAANFRGLSSCYFRLATQTNEKNQLLIDALIQWSKLNS
ncbi:aminotransferase class I/II-fold pyridoxal phosphate-dependent enzyme [Labilibaculum sp. A4]|uniref:pyridoxal phosphate-dependent aminotransferase n=1 Tax=Labilibaculum euxinus TaxID=2686357 RepID=UPI000F61E3CB|nr:aminotransferase class I/II-fold pyridoxal phosphate-dependent enzyme [Labilibaculum euxinus]MDQ1770289.1 aminotransferase class I/II-fold pyridoxal phosphate-dependent enzyme [Labilibaculum euxinus]MWN75492.1 aminotransferase class I/II-fold pyridoxal phosphate-dependent enzyme [Labilibaculum euxinus]